MSAPTTPPRCEPPEHLRGVDGWHWVQLSKSETPVVAWWTSDGFWKGAASEASISAETAAGFGYRYIAPVTPPEEVEALRAELDALKTLVTIPGVWRCPKCEFRLLQSNLNASDGTVTARDTPGDTCPNCAGPLWRVTYKDDHAEAMQLAERFCQEAAAIRARVETLEAALLGIVREQQSEAQAGTGEYQRGYDDCIAAHADLARAVLEGKP